MTALGYTNVGRRSNDTTYTRDTSHIDNLSYIRPPQHAIYTNFWHTYHQIEEETSTCNHPDHSYHTSLHDNILTIHSLRIRIHGDWKGIF